MITLEGVSKRFGPRGVLKGIDLEVEGGETLCVFGHNGSGKTTLLKLMAGILRPSEGEILIDGRQPRRTRGVLGYLGHEPHVYPSLTALENLRFFARLHDLSSAHAEVSLATVGLEALSESLTRHLSRGEAQRLGLARALLGDPEVLLVDEPFAGLDTGSADSLPALLEASGRTIVMATHDAARASAFSDRAVTLEDGSLG